MDIIKLKSFATLAKKKSFSETADLLYLSQPAISKHIQSLEDELGVSLFNRNRKNTTLTVHGQYFLPYASEIIRLSERSKEHLKQLEDINEGTLHFGATNFIGVYLMPELIKEFKSFYPDINIDINISPSKILFKKLENYEIEFAFVSHYVDLDDSKYSSLFYTKDHMTLIVASDHHLASKRSCRISDINNETYISKESSSSLSKFIQNKFNLDSLNNNIVINNQEAIKQTVIEGMGISIMSTKSVEVEIKAGLLKSIEIEGLDLDREIHLIYHKKFSLTPAAQAFFELLNL